VQVPETVSAGRNKKGRKKSLASQTGESQGGDGKICLYGALAPFHLVQGLAKETPVGKVTFEPGPNEAQGSRFSPLGFTSSLKSYSLRKLSREVQKPGFFCLNPGGSHCLRWRGF